MDLARRGTNPCLLSPDLESSVWSCSATTWDHQQLVTELLLVKHIDQAHANPLTRCEGQNLRNRCRGAREVTEVTRLHGAPKQREHKASTDADERPHGVTCREGEENPNERADTDNPFCGAVACLKDSTPTVASGSGTRAAHGATRCRIALRVVFAVAVAIAHFATRRDPHADHVAVARLLTDALEGIAVEKVVAVRHELRTVVRGGRDFAAHHVPAGPGHLLGELLIAEGLTGDRVELVLDRGDPFVRELCRVAPEDPTVGVEGVRVTVGVPAHDQQHDGAGQDQPLVEVRLRADVDHSPEEDGQRAQQQDVHKEVADPVQRDVLKENATQPLVQADAHPGDQTPQRDADQDVPDDPGRDVTALLELAAEHEARGDEEGSETRDAQAGEPAHAQDPGDEAEGKADDEAEDEGAQEGAEEELEEGVHVNISAARS